MPEPTTTAPRPALRELIRTAMRAKGIRSVDGEQGLARRAGIARNTIYAWEGGAYPRIGELERLGRFLEVPAWQMLRAWEAGETAEPVQPDVVLYRNGEPMTVVEVKGLDPEAIAEVQAAVDKIITRPEVLELVAGVEQRVTQEIIGNRDVAREITDALPALKGLSALLENYRQELERIVQQRDADPPSTPEPTVQETSARR